MNRTRIAIGSDHAGFQLKSELSEYIISLGYQIHDVGTHDNVSTDYPVYGKKVGESITLGNDDLGIAICGTGIGISIAANKVPGIRAANVRTVEEAILAKQHNNANVLCLGARITDTEKAKALVKAWLTTTFLGGRHCRRIAELAAEDEHDDITLNALFLESQSDHY